jgi:hypothetical protein
MAVAPMEFAFGAWADCISHDIGNAIELNTPEIGHCEQSGLE